MIIIGKLKEIFLNKLHEANFNKITKYILNVSIVLVNDYEQKKKFLPKTENKIRSIILEEYIKKQKKSYGMEGYRFDAEIPENYVGNGAYIGRVDIRVLLKNDFEKEDAYYVIECKRIDGTKTLNKKYVNEGILRFIEEKYSSYYNRNIMWGFVVKKINIAENTLSIQNIQDYYFYCKNYSKFQHININKYVKYNKFQSVNINKYNKCKLVEIYKCGYQIDSKKMELFHIFSDYSSIIK